MTPKQRVLRHKRVVRPFQFAKAVKSIANHGPKWCICLTTGVVLGQGETAGEAWKKAAWNIRND